MIDYIPGTSLSIKQDRNKFSFGVDSILLSSFAKKAEYALDLGAGNGILILRLMGLGKIESGMGIEIQEEVFELFKENVEINNLSDKIKAIKGDYKFLNESLKNHFNIVISNPPYVKRDGGIVPKDINKQRSRYELDMTFKDLVRASNYYLKPGGSFFFSHKPERLAELFSSLQEFSLEPKRMRLIQPNIDKAPNLVLIEARKKAKGGLKLLPTLFVYEKDGTYSQELLEEYKGNQ